MEYSKKYSAIEPSITLAISAKEKKMKSEGIDIIGFSVGEPDFKTPENIRKKAIDSIENDPIGYTAADGMPNLKKSIIKKLKNDNGLDYEPGQIVVSNGAKHSLHNAIEAIVNPGDEIIVPSPYWVSYIELINMSGAKPVIIEGLEENEFKITAADISSVISDKTKAIIINSPSNPTGALYTRDELMKIADLAIKEDLIVISDEIYEKLIYDGEHISIASFSEEIKERTIVINGMSKAYAMTGWRIGYTASNKEIASIMSNMQSHATSNPNTVAQYASIEALEGDTSSIDNMKAEFNLRRDLMVSLVNEIPLLSCKKPKGAFYVMVNISNAIGKKIKNIDINGSMDFANLLLEDAQVAVVPGIAFGVDNYVRLSYATSQEKIKEGLNRIKKCLE